MKTQFGEESPDLVLDLNWIWFFISIGCSILLICCLPSSMIYILVILKKGICFHVCVCVFMMSSGNR